jgi:diguanylate cyclase (GGDEF)-like protein
MAYHWSTHQLTEYFAAVSGPQEEHRAIMVAVERAAEALDAEVGAVVIDGVCRGSVGFGAGTPPENVVAADVGAETITAPRLGTLHATVAVLVRGSGERLLVARASEPFSAEERQMLQGMAQVLGLALRGLRTLVAERSLREEREREAEQRLHLLDALRGRQRLLETLLGIQRAISNRKPLQDVLDSVTAGAAGLLDRAAVTLVLADPFTAGQLIIASSSGESRSAEDEAVLAAAAAAMAVNDVVTRAGGTGGRAIVAAPVPVEVDMGGSLVAETVDRDIVEQRELLSAFAQQVSLALTDARTVEAMREAYHDSLTGLPNRALFLDRLKHAIVASDRRSQRVTVLFIDLDRFKAVNDSLGHKAGDELLAMVADRLRACIRGSDTAARLGGDEFAILLEGADCEDGVRIGHAVIDAVKKPFRIAGRDVFIAASIGVASASASGVDPGEVLSNADVAMYRAKKTGTGRTIIFEPHMHAEVVERLSLQGDLQRALGLGELRLQYQPLVRLDTVTPVGVEALLRWRHPRRGEVPPGAFIGVAEETGVVLDLGRWVLREACRQVVEWRRVVPTMTLNVNVSARQVGDAGFVPEVALALADTGLAADFLTLELTETALMADPASAQSQLRDLKSIGVRLAVDDFGTGYSSLSYLRQFPVDQLKIDRTFVAGVGDRTDNLAVARTVVELGRTLRLETVAEGIEDAAQLEALRELGCDLGQGYHLARPLEADAVCAHFAGARRGPAVARVA